MSVNPLFKFAHEDYVVRVENIAQWVSSQEIVELFSSLIGEVSKCSGFIGEGCRRFLELTFSTQDAFKKALCMTGYTVAGVPLNVRAIAGSNLTDSQRVFRQGKPADTRRNLYVLGLPFDLNKTEFTEIFSRHGHVSHAVILATVDNASRRRGFIVMSTHAEAKVAMDALSRKEIKGHTIDVSWAVVQRSQGFLDGGDRTVMLSSHSGSISPPSSPFELDTVDCTSSRLQTPGIATPLMDSQLPLVAPHQSSTSSALLVTNLPAALFSSDADLHPLFCPYGQVKHLKILDASPASISQGTTSVIVEYDSSAQAREARDMLCGQVYANQSISANFVEANSALPTCPGPDNWNPAIANLKARLNPYAAPFSVQSGHAIATAPDAPIKPFAPFSRQHNVPKFNYDSGVPTGLVSNPYQSAPLTPPLSAQAYLQPPPVFVRPNSAPSRWTDEGRLSRLPSWACSS